MILTDSGPLVAIFDRGEQHHQVCVDCLSELIGPMLTTWPAFTEAMYLLGEAGGWTAQSVLWRIVNAGDVEIVFQNSEQGQRMQSLMKKYHDQPMDLADASLVALAEEHDLRSIFTLDRRDFSVYSLRGRRTLRLIPAVL